MSIKNNLFLLSRIIYLRDMIIEIFIKKKSFQMTLEHVFSLHNIHILTIFQQSLINTICKIRNDTNIQTQKHFIYFSA